MPHLLLLTRSTSSSRASRWRAHPAGFLIYLGILALTRFVPKREAGTISLPDLLMTCSSRRRRDAMAVEYHSMTEGLLLIFTIVLWTYTLPGSASASPATFSVCCTVLPLPP